MNQKITKQYITENLLTVKRGLNSNKTKLLKETAEDLYLIYHNIEAPKCECGNTTTFSNFLKGYSPFCSLKCAQNSLVTKLKKEQTCLKNHGVKYTSQSKELREKMKVTCLKNHGVEYALQSPTIQEKMKETMVKSHGVEHSMQSSKIREKSKETCLKLYGVEHNSQSSIIKEKKKVTNLKNWGVDNVFKSEEIKTKIKETNLNNLGVEYISQSSIIKEKKKVTSMRKWGTEHHMQSGLFGFGYKHKDYIYPSGKVARVQGNENYLLDELILTYNENEILTDRKDMPEFWYFTGDGKKHRYFPDVYIPKDNTIYEVKSYYTLEQGKKNNIFNLKKQSVIEEGYDFILRIF